MRSAALLLLPVLYAQAQVTLYLGGEDDSIDTAGFTAVAGGTQGDLSTYFVHTTSVPPEATDDPFALVGTITVVQGPSQVSAHYERPEVTLSTDLFCTWAGDEPAEALCTVTDPAGGVSTESSALIPMTFALGSSVSGAPAAPTSGAPSSASAPVTPRPTASNSSPGASQSANPSASKSGSSEAPAASDDGSAGRNAVSTAIFAVGAASFWLL